MRYLIIGGTGTLGKELVSRFYERHEITIFSRDEFKQSHMKKVYPNIRYIIGDIRNERDLEFDFSNYDMVYHTAALKHVDIGEVNVWPFIDVNLNGTINVARSCQKAGVKLVFFSTDKAVLPINTYGMSKALAEKYIQANNDNAAIFRWGNILGSRGSIVPAFVKIIKNDGIVPITHVEMTRFWLTINEVVDFVIEKESHKNPKKILIPTVLSAKVTDLALSIGKILDKTVKFKDIGIRPGEKIHEHLYTDYEYCIRSDNCAKYTIDDLILKLKPIVDML